MLESLLPIALPVGMLAALGVGVMIGRRGEEGVRQDLNKVVEELKALQTKLNTQIKAKISAAKKK